MDRDDIIPIPLRPDFTARVHVPLDLTRAEAEKIARVVLAFGQQTDGAGGGEEGK